MALATATLVYLANATGPVAAAPLAGAMQAAALAFLTPNVLELLASTLISAIGDVTGGGQARLTIVLNISSALFQKRFPSVEAGGAGPFPEHWTGNLRAACNQPVLASTPVFA